MNAIGISYLAILLLIGVVFISVVEAGSTATVDNEAPKKAKIKHKAGRFMGKVMDSRRTRGKKSVNILENKLQRVEQPLRRSMKAPSYAKTVTRHKKVPQQIGLGRTTSHDILLSSGAVMMKLRLHLSQGYDRISIDRRTASRKNNRLLRVK